MQRADYDAEIEPIQPSGKKGRVKDKGKEKKVPKKDDKSVKGKDARKRGNKADEKDKKKNKGKKGKESAALLDDPELTEAEVQYYTAIQKEMDKYAGIVDPNEDDQGPSPVERGKKKREEKKVDKEGGKKGNKKSPRSKEKHPEPGYVILKKKPATIQEAYEDRIKRMEAAEEARIAEEMAKISDGEDSGKNKTPRKSGRGPREQRSIKRTVIKPCDEAVVCEPKICCKDVQSPRPKKPGKEDEQTRGDLSAADVNLSQTKFNKIISRFSVDIAPLKEYSAEEKQIILKEKDAKPKVLEHELRLAKKEIREDIERLKSGRTTPRQQLPTVVESAIQELPDETDEAAEYAEQKATAGLDDELLEVRDTEAEMEKQVGTKRKTQPETVDPCLPKKAVTSVFEVVAPLTKTKVRPVLPKAVKLDLAYKMRDTIEEVYPRISAAANIKIGPLPELRPREPTLSEISEDEGKKKKTKKQTKKDSAE